MIFFLFFFYNHHYVPTSLISSERLKLLEFISVFLALLTITICLYGLLLEQNRYTLLLEYINKNLEKKKDQYHFIAHHDTLTGLTNREYLNKNLSFIAKNLETNESIYILYVDLDKMKKINDTYGHDIGDEVLSTFSKRLKKSFKKADIITRLGGDEFIVVLKTKSTQTIIKKVTQRAIDLNLKPIQFGESVSIKLTLSIGVACFPFDGQTIKETLKMADMALYQAKKSGRNCYKLWSEIGH
jgi:diguanylate cyclase